MKLDEFSFLAILGLGVVLTLFVEHWLLPRVLPKIFKAKDRLIESLESECMELKDTVRDLKEGAEEKVEEFRDRLDGD